MQPRLDNSWLIGAFYLAVAAATATTRFEPIALVSLALMVILVVRIAYAAEAGPYARLKQSDLTAHMTVIVLTFAVMAIVEYVVGDRLVSAITAASVLLGTALVLRMSGRKVAFARIRVSTLTICAVAFAAGGILSAAFRRLA